MDIKQLYNKFNAVFPDNHEYMDIISNEAVILDGVYTVTELRALVNLMGQLDERD